jgi:lysophospholipase L1-like esterase
MKIEDIDKNFKKTELNGLEFNFFNALAEPFKLEGFGWYEQEHELRRLPQWILPEINEGAATLSACSAGGAIRFKTDSSSIAIMAEVENPNGMGHMPRSGHSGFDLYLKTENGFRFVANARAEEGQLKAETVMFDGKNNEMREWMLYLPLYNVTKTVEIGIDAGVASQILPVDSLKKPVLFYGSSITQGGCASRPGNAYTHIVCRRLGTELINFGFSGCGRGELAVAQAISELELSAFVMDYDHNAPDPEHLKATHEAFFKEVRKHRPDLPIILVSKPDFDTNSWENMLRREIIQETYDNALNSGDQHVYFVDGETLFGDYERDACTVDGCHPNDLGFMRMADVITPVVKEAIG